MSPGMNVVLISRTQAKLDAAAGEIEAKHGVKTKTVAVDFAQANGETYARLREELAPLQVPPEHAPHCPPSLAFTRLSMGRVYWTNPHTTDGRFMGHLQVGVLVNNVGVSYPHAEYYEAIDDCLIDDLVNINIQATNKVRRSACIAILAASPQRVHEVPGRC